MYGGGLMQKYLEVTRTIQGGCLEGKPLGNVPASGGMVVNSQRLLQRW